MQKAIERAEPSIACILVTRAEGGRKFEPENPTFVPELYGSGVVIDDSGLVLTNEHVIRGSTARYVRLPGEKGCSASILAADQRSDLAVLKLEARGGQFKPIALGQGEKLRKGQFVLSLANPFAAGFRDGSPSASWGIISNLRRRAPLIEVKKEEQSIKPLSQFATLIQTDARLNLGCSGGALIDLDGKLVGLTTALAALNGSETPGGFALPMDRSMRGIVERLRRGEEVEYGFLGVEFLAASGARGGGVQVRALPGGPAASAGMPTEREGCVILSVNEIPTRDQPELSFLISTALASSTIKVEWRSLGGGSNASNVKLSKLYMPAERFVATKRPRPIGGLRVDYITTLARGDTNPFYYTGFPRGVVIREVQSNSAADKAQLAVDMVITHVNGLPVASPADFYLAVDAAANSLELTIQGRSERIPLDLR
jgi:S1-C subfamily serine protease